MKKPKQQKLDQLQKTSKAAPSPHSSKKPGDDIIAISLSRNDIMGIVGLINRAAIRGDESEGVSYLKQKLVTAIKPA